MKASSDVAEKQAVRFVAEFVNCGWSLTGYQARLEALASLSAHPVFSRFMPKHPVSFPNEAQNIEPWITPGQWRMVFWQDFLRKVWGARAVSERRAVLHACIGLYCSYLAGLDDMVSRATVAQVFRNPRVREGFGQDTFLTALILVSNFVSKMKRCVNRKECSRPLFFAQRKDQKICLSTECRTWARKEIKKRSWKKHGHEWRPGKRSKKSQQKGEK